MAIRLHACSFHGRVLTQGQSPALRLTEVSYDPYLRNPKHSHEYAYLGITLSGASTQSCGRELRVSKPWTVIYHPAGESHSDRFHEKGARELNIEMPPATIAGFRERFQFHERAAEQSGGRAAGLAARLYSEFRLMDELSWMAIEGITIELMAEVLRRTARPAGGRPPSWLRQASEMIRERFAERLTLRGIASAAGVHPVHLAREFHRYMGLTVGQRIRQLRVERACDLLSEDGISLAEIALAAGFSDQSQFSKTFKNLVGTTPFEYRRSKFAC